MTSATLAVSGTFEFAKTRLGLPYARTLVVPGHFDYRKQALLYVPSQLPDPRDPAFTKMAAEEIIRLLEASRGPAFLLFPSSLQIPLVSDRLSLPCQLPT